ncbi:TetR/AcrR family transcriptional regulator [Erythrobacter ani]|uniref:TetR/AcrR family transcriptional regulator n=1 Tax=Erythrobacter ani TaxID=2827235 RepID=A0ABS6SK49_9SPHN|nr:TetR/AcrR family transcriptional regulator [Erythrobacter ani]MBV7265251.1 TetR/AcrR family transcriptional regulator [Erythrobacter ani]
MNDQSRTILNERSKKMRAASFDREETIEKIMNAFWEHGYEATSIQVLEAATGLKRQSLYNAFGNKDAMFELASNRYDMAVSRKLFATLDHADPVIALREFFAAQLAVLVDADQPAGCFVAGGQQELANRSEGQLSEQMRAMIEEQHDQLVAAFERWKADGKIADETDTHALSAIVMALVRGQAVLGRSSLSYPIIEQSAALAPGLIERYLAAPT